MTNPHHPDSNVPTGPSGIVPRRLPFPSNFMNHPERTSVVSQLLSRASNMTSDSPANHYDSTRDAGGDHDRYGSRSNGASSRQEDAAMSRAPQFGSFSRAFEMLTEGAHPDVSPAKQDGFFIPSYLRGTAYAQKLEESTRQKALASQNGRTQAARGTGNASTAAPTSNGSLSNKTVQASRSSVDSARNSAATEEKEQTPPIPTKWNKDDKYSSGIDVMGDCLEVRYTSHKPQHEYETASIRANHAIPPECGMYYYEVTVITGKREDTTIGVGLSAKSVHLHRPPGWEPDSWGYHGDDGNCFHAASSGKSYGPKFTTGDVIGCGINFNSGCIFFTKNGQNLGTAFRDVKGTLYPSVGLKKHGEHILVNFGLTPFVFDIDGMMKREKDKIREQISQTSTTQLVPKLSEKELIQSLVLQFLQHDGYIETARIFADEIQTERQSLAVGDTPVNDIHVKDDQDATNRQRIRKAILEGDIDRALKYIHNFYPKVLPDNEDVYFELKCRRFIEMVRKAAEARLMSEGQRTNGLDSSQAMELDTNGVEHHSWEQMDTEDGFDHVSQLEQEMLEYGGQLELEYRNHPNKETRDTLERIFSLMAYTHPFKEPRVAYLLDRKGRVVVAELVNTTILKSLHKSVVSDLENFYHGTGKLVEQLREGGGPGAFVSLQDIVDEIPKTQQF